MVKIKSEDKDSFLYELSKLYYRDKINQDKLSKIFKLSRASISRFLTEAEKKKIVNISLTDISGKKYRLEKEIEDKYNIKKAIVSVVPGNDEKLLKRSIGRVAASFVSKQIKNNTSIGIAWGTTIREFTNFLEPKKLKDVKVFDLLGSMGNLYTGVNASELARRVANNFNAKNYFLNSLSILRNKELKEQLIKEEEIKYVLSMYKKLDIAVISTGFIAGRLKLDNKVFHEASEMGGIGDVCFRFFDKNGKKIKIESDDRIIGISLEDYKNIKLKICVAGSLEKLEAIRGLLKGGLVDVLITDSIVAYNL